MIRGKFYYIIVCVVIGVFSLLMVNSCSEKEKDTASTQEAVVVPEERVPESPYYTPSEELKERHDSIIRELNKKVIAQAITVEHNARTASEAYDELYPATLCIVPKEEIAHQWEEDYQFMCEHMIYGETPSFTSLIGNIRTLNSKIQQFNYQK